MLTHNAGVKAELHIWVCDAPRRFGGGAPEDREMDAHGHGFLWRLPVGSGGALEISHEGTAAKKHMGRLATPRSGPITPAKYCGSCVESRSSQSVSSRA